MARRKTINLNDALFAFENGTSTGTDIVRLFSRLIQSGLAWQLQGFYDRQAKWLIESGYLATSGKVLKYPKDEEEN